jgi:hypothetical protein
MIKKGLNDDILYQKSVSSMKKKKVMFIDQLIDKELKILLSWKFIKAINSSPKNGPEPKWFKKLRRKYNRK